ncbi:DUF2303 family protein [Burkholderia metallica]|uniref:DUF2303 family protein n=1 Tax=Burkholderia metallica TaxID=488729 RepID=UPI001CF57288|nr:DUF2303 family protein [Burkholderia metallica]MCA8017778.1 YfdQ family protein [Burkholderia metallica]
MPPLTDITESNTEIAAAIAAGASLAEIRKNPHDKRKSVVLVPEGYGLEELVEPEYPARPTGTAKMRDVVSFIALFNRQKRDCSLVYATLDPARFVAVIDDNFPAADVGGAKMGANWQEQRIDFTVPPSREWRTWTESNRKPMHQLQFAEFIEDNLPDIIQPTGSDMLTMALNFEASKNGRFVSNTRLSDGNVEFTWKEDVESAVGSAGQKLTMPQQIKIRIPVFENSDPVDMDVRIKFRVAEQTLKIWYELVRPHKVLEAGFRAIWAEIEDKAKTNILLGQPE